MSALLCCLPGAGYTKDELPSSVQDLAYGEVLYYYYQEDFLSTITQLQVAQQQHRLKFHKDEAKLLEGSLYLAYGMHKDAREIFERLLDDDTVSLDVRNQVWYHLARMAFQRGYTDDADQALARMEGKLSDELSGKQRMLQAQIYMHRKEYNAAADLLRGWRKPEALKPYAEYNRAVAQIRAGHIEPGLKTFEALADSKAETREQSILRDQTELDLGFTLLREEQPDRAEKFLSRVKLDSPLSNNALLGAGWASAQQKNFRQALVYWEALSKRDPIDHAVQESLLAVPYAYTRLQAFGPAAKLYQDAVTALKGEQAHLNTAIQNIQDGKLLQSLEQMERNELIGGMWEIDALPRTEETRYLTNLLATNEFREAMRSYLDLRIIAATLNDWSADVTAFDDILATRRSGYDQAAPEVSQKMAGIDVDELRQRQQQLEQRYEAAKKNNDYLAVGSPEPLQWWARLEALEPKIKALPAGAKYDRLREKYKFLKGVMRWQMSSDYKARLWDLRKGLDQLDSALLVAEVRRDAVSRALTDAPKGFQGYGERIRGYEQQLDELQSRTKTLLAAQGETLQNMALKELDAQYRALNQYIMRAQFSLAQIYDSAHTPQSDQEQ